MSGGRVTDSLTLDFAGQVAAFESRDPAEPEIARLQRAVADGLACMAAAHEFKAGHIYSQIVLDEGGRAEALVVGTPCRLPAARAALVNGYLMNLPDHDDTYGILGHIGAVVLPAALAMAESRDASDIGLIRALAGGYDVAIRLGSALEPSPDRKREVRGFITWQIFGAAAAAAIILRLDPTQIASAFGIAGCQAPVPFMNKWGYPDGHISWIKNNSGWAAMAGVYAALLASRGFQASQTILDGPTGFWRMAGTDRFNPEALYAPSVVSLDDLAIKPYPCCRFLHTTVEAAARLAPKLRQMNGQVRAIRVTHAMAFVRDNFLLMHPKSPIDAQFSLPLIVAAALVGDPTDSSWIHPSRLQDKNFARLMSMISHIDPPRGPSTSGTPDLTSSVSVELGNGQVLTEEVVHPLGGGHRPLPDDIFRQKVTSLLFKRYEPNIVNEILNCTFTLGLENSIARLWQLLEQCRGTNDLGRPAPDTVMRV